MIISDCKCENISGIYDLPENELGKNVSVETLENRINKMLGDSDYKIFVAESNDETVGFIGVHFGLAFEIDGRVMRIIALAVKEEYQNKGIGTALVKTVEEYARHNGVTVVGVNSGLQRAVAHKFYEKQGFYRKGYSFIKSLE